MEKLYKKINTKINKIIWSFVSTGILFLILAVLIVWTEFILRLIAAMMALLLAYAFIFIGYKISILKKDIEKHFKFLNK